MTYDEALSYYGNQTKLGEALGVTQSTVSSWGGALPPHYQYQLEIITHGKLRVGEELRRPGALRVLQGGKLRKKGPLAREIVYGRRATDR